jgi:Ca2+-dependent lipid-binding protein
MGVLVVYLDKVTNLADEDHIGKSDPYVKFELEQDNIFKDKDFGKRKSSKKKDESNPEYGETFTWADVPGLDNLVLKVEVMDDDLVSDDKLGSVNIKLEKMEGLEDGLEGEWTVDDNWFSKDAKIFLKITWTE